MTDYLIVLPSAWQPYTDACLATMSRRARQRTMIVDNVPPAVNVGVSRSWNQGIDRVLGESIDWLVLLSAAVRFEHGGDDFLDRLDDTPSVGVVEGGDGTVRGAMGWHLIAFHRDVLARVGRFDEQWFAYMEDVDYAWRMILAYSDDRPDLEYSPHAVSIKAPCAGWVESAAHSCVLAHVNVNFVENEERFAAKWLTEPYVDGVSYTTPPWGRGVHLRHPYGVADLDWKYTGPPRPPVWETGGANG